MGWVGTGAAFGAIGQLPGDEQAAPAADLHAGESLVEAGNQAAHALGKGHGLRIALLGLAVVAEHRLAVLVFEWLSGVVVGGVELVPVSGQPASVMNLVHLVGLGLGAGADFEVLVAQGKGCLDDAFHHGHSGRQLDAGRCGSRMVRRGRGGSRLGRGLGACGSGACRQEQNQNGVFH